MTVWRTFLLRLLTKRTLKDQWPIIVCACCPAVRFASPEIRLRFEAGPLTLNESSCYTYLDVFLFIRGQKKNRLKQ